MVWFIVDDKFHSAEEVLSIPREIRPAAIGLWTLAGAWSSDHLKDGYVPLYVLDQVGADEVLADELVRVKLWTKTKTGYQFRNWAKWQQTREDVEGRRKAERDRKNAYREQKRAEREKSGERPAPVPPGHPRDKGGSPGHQALTQSPTQPIPINNTPSPPAGGAAAFAEWYMAYPRKVGKEAARKAYDRVVRKVAPAVLLAAARKYSADPNLPEKQFIPHPATWLNQGRWEDEPLPPRAGGTLPPDSWNGLRELPVDE
jgi:hypothetical protein